MADLYAHLQRWGDDVDRFLGMALPRGIKFMGSTSPEHVKRVKEIYGAANQPEPFMWRREWWDDKQSEWIMRGADGARLWDAHFSSAMTNWAKVGVNVFELENEFIANSNEMATKEAEFIAEAARLCSLRGIRVIAGNHSVWWPKQEHMALYGPAMSRVAAYGGYWGSHEYAWPGTHPNGTDLLHSDALGWHRRMMEINRNIGYSVPRWIITELGWDQALMGPEYGHHGFRSLPAEQQQSVLGWIQWYLQNRTDPSVLGACWFQTGSQSDWQEFDIVGSLIESDISSWVRQSSKQTIRVLRTRIGTVQTLPLEEYLKGVLISEVPWYWPKAALDAQAIWARSYALYRIGHPKHGEQGADICDTACCQAYSDSRLPSTNEAVIRTTGIVWDNARNHMYEYVEKCGRPDCPLCKGQGGYKNRVWEGRACQRGAQHIAESLNGNSLAITGTYYPGFAENAGEFLPEHEPIWNGRGIREKVRWWIEEATRNLERNNQQRALTLLHSLTARPYGLLYRSRFIT